MSLDIIPGKHLKSITPTVTKLKHLITTKTDTSNVGMILMHQAAVEDIRVRSGKLAANCEYQTHYWALVIRATAPDNSILDI